MTDSPIGGPVRPAGAPANPSQAAVNRRLRTAGRRRQCCVHCEDTLRKRDDRATCFPGPSRPGCRGAAARRYRRR